jgi:hypothetical protein
MRKHFGVIDLCVYKYDLHTGKTNRRHEVSQCVLQTENLYFTNGTYAYAANAMNMNNTHYIALSLASTTL